MTNETYYAKTTINGKITRIQTFDFEPKFDSNSAIQLITKEEYEELYEKRKELFIAAPRMSKYHSIPRRMEFSNSEKSVTSTIPKIPYEKFDLIIYAKDLYFNGYVDSSTGCMNGFVAINSVAENVLVDSASSIKFSFNGIDYTISIEEDNSISIKIDLIDFEIENSYVIDVQTLYNKRL